MALSSSEHELLVETCTNMNVAANTCHEVLEMLRNLGNTGVVDIAAHNTAQGRHADDKTLFHVTVGSNYKRYTFNNPLNNTTGEYYNCWEKNIVRDTFLKTWGNTSSGAPKDVHNHTNSFTDSNGDNIAFSTHNGNSNIALYYDLFKLKDETVTTSDINVAAGIRYYANRPQNFSDATGINPYSTIGLMVSVGTYGSIEDVIRVTYPAMYPNVNNTITLGTSNRAFKDLYVVNAPTVTSDRRAKKDIAPLESQAVDFIKSLRPVSYALVQSEGHIDPVDINGNPISVENPPADKEGTRTHWGFIAQEVKEAMTSAGIEDAAVWCLTDKNDPDSQQSLRYEELIAPLVKAVQVLAAKVEALEGK